MNLSMKMAIHFSYGTRIKYGEGEKDKPTNSKASETSQNAPAAPVQLNNMPVTYTPAVLNAPARPVDTATNGEMIMEGVGKIEYGQQNKAYRKLDKELTLAKHDQIFQ